MSWVHNLVNKICNETADGARASQSQQCVWPSAESILEYGFWRGREHNGFGQTAQGRFLRPLYSSLRSGQNVRLHKSFVIFLPYLHWETKQQYLLRNKCLDKASLQSSLRPASRAVLGLEQKMNRTVKPSLETNNDSRGEIWKSADMDIRPTQSPHARLVLEYIDDLHIRRTLDQFHYFTLPDDEIRARDFDQVLYRYTKTLQPTSSAKDCQRLLMVDQLWLWLIDVPMSGNGQKIVITAFPERWTDRERSAWRNNAEHSDVRYKVMNAIENGERQILNIQDFVCLVIDKCSSLFHPRSTETEQWDKLAFRDAFAISIGRVGSDQTAYMNQLWRHSQRLSALRERWKQLSETPWRYIWRSNAKRQENEKFSRAPTQASNRRASSDYFEPGQEAVLEDLAYLRSESIFALSVLEGHMRNEADKLIDITGEIDCLREIKDIRDELHSILAVFREELKVVDAWVSEISNDGLGPLCWGVKHLRNTIEQRHADIKDLSEEASRVYAAGIAQ